MRPRTLLVLAVVVALLGAFIWFVERDLPSSDERAVRAKRVLSLDAEAVEGLTIEWDERVVELRRRQREVADPGHAAETEFDWQLVRPLNAPADPTAVSSLISRLVELDKERTLEEVGRAEVGLAEPRGRVTLVSPDRTEVVEIGAEIPASSNMTLAVEGRDEVYVVAASVWSTLTKEPGDWRDKALFRDDREAIERLTLTSDEQRVEIARRGEEYWIESPLVDRADREAVDALLTEIVGLRAQSFVDAPTDEETSTAFDRPLGTVEVALRGEEAPFRLVLGTAPSEGEGVAASGQYARLGGQIVRLNTGLAESFERSADGWRSLDWSVSEVYRIERAVIEDGSGRVEVRREGGDWLRDGEVIGYGPATDLLFDIAGASASHWIDHATELGAPEMTVTIDSDDGTQEVLELFAQQEDGVPVRASDRETVLVLSSDVASSIRSKLSDLRAARVEGGAESDAESGSGSEDRALR